MPDLKYRLENAISSRGTNGIDLASHTNELLNEIGLSIDSCGGHLSFSGSDPLIDSEFRFGATSSIALACKAIAASSIWVLRGGQPQDISIDVRRAFQKFYGFFTRKWILINGRAPARKWALHNPFCSGDFFRRTADGRYMLALNTYPSIQSNSINFLNCSNNNASINQAIRSYDANQLEEEADKHGLAFAKIRTLPELFQESQYKDVLANFPLISIEKLDSTPPIKFSENPTEVLSGIRALGMGHVIAGGAIGRDLASFGADVLNIWRPNDCEDEFIYWDAQVGVRSTYLEPKEESDMLKFYELLDDADIFYINRQKRFIDSLGLDAKSLCKRRPGLIHAQITVHGDSGPWSNRPGYDLIGAAVSGIYTPDGNPFKPQHTSIVPIVDNVCGWLVSVGILAALRRRAIEGGSYSVKISLTRVCLWLTSLGLMDRRYVAAELMNKEDIHKTPPELFTAKTCLGIYQGMTEQIKFSSIKTKYRTVLEPMGSSFPEWLQ